MHPDQETVIPFAPEAIEKDASKNDCELNAAKRLLNHIKTDHTKLPILIVVDALYANAPFVKLLESLGFSYIIGVKEADHHALFSSVQDKIFTDENNEFKYYDNKLKRTRGFRFINNLTLNKSNPDLLVNFLEYWETGENDNFIVYFAWITDVHLTKDNSFQIMKSGRARWKVENEVFNTPKNQGYNLEHSYGHGKQHLATIFAMLTMLAFLIDQVQECCCELFQQSKDRFRTRAYLWDKMRALFLSYFRLVGLLSFCNT